MADELNGGAPAPVETTAVAEAPAPEVTETKAEPTPRGAIDRAFDAVDAQERGEAPKAETTPEAKPAAETGERERNPDGTFKAKDPATASQPAQDGKEAAPATTEAKPAAAPLSEPPTRFSADAKAAWAGVPEPVKGEVHRALREAEQGIEKYRADATTYNEVFRPYVDLARASNLDPKVALDQYVKIDQLLAADFDKGIATIFQNKGIDPRQWAAQVAGKEVEPQDKVVGELRQHIARLEQQISGVTGSVQQQRAVEIERGIERFAAALPETDRTLFQELDSEIATEMGADPSITLAQAFERAKTKATDRYTRLFGQPQTQAAPSTQPAAAQTGTVAPTAQTGKGMLSVTGAPGVGSDPTTRKPPSSPRAALDRAFADLGIA